METCSKEFSLALKEKGIEMETHFQISDMDNGEEVNCDKLHWDGVPVYTISDILSKEFLEKVVNIIGGTDMYWTKQDWEPLGREIYHRFCLGGLPAVESYILSLIK